MPGTRFRISPTKATLLVTASTKVAAVVFSAGSAALVASLGGQTQLGYFSLFRVILAIFVLMTGFGISDAYPYLIRRISHDAELVLRSGACAFLLIAFVQLGLWSALAFSIQSIFLRDIDINLVLLLGIAAPFQVVHLHLVNFFRSVEKVRLANLVFVSTEVLLFFTIAVFAANAGVTHRSIIIAIVFSWAAVAITYLVVLWRLGYSFLPKADWDIIAESFRYGVKAQASNAFQVLNYRIDQLMVGGFLGAADLGLYAVASKSAELFRFFSRSISFAIEPILAGQRFQDSYSYVRKYRSRVFATNCVLMVIGLLVIPLILPIVFGEWSSSAVPYFYVLSLGLILGGSNGLVGAYNKSVGRPERNARVAMHGLFVAATLNATLVPTLGIVGAAWASVITQAFVTVFFWWQFRKDAPACDNESKETP